MSAALATCNGDATVRALRERLDIAVAENDALRQMLAPPGFLPKSFELTSYEERALKALLTRTQWTKESLLASIYIDASADEMPGIKVVDVLVYKLRLKMKRFGLVIDTYWGDGYGISLPNRAHLTRIIEAEHAKNEVQQ